jgi:hypothetical protein
MRFFISIVSLLVVAAPGLSDRPAYSAPMFLAPTAMVPFPADGIVKIQHSPPRPFTASEQSLPPNGHVQPKVNANNTAPFRVLTRGGDTHYFVKLEESGTGRSVLTVFVRAGHQVDMRVPFGTYVVKYSSGQKWYGYKHLFGPDTSYNKADSTFTF